MRFGFLVTDAAIRRLDRVVIGIGLVLATGLALLGGSILFTNGAASRTRDEVAIEESRQATARATLDLGKLARNEPLTRGLEENVAGVQAWLQAAAESERVELASFEGKAAPTAYVTKHSAKIAAEGWQSIECQVDLRGELPKIYNVVRSLRGGAYPVEVGSVSITGSPNDSEVSVGVSLTILGKSFGTPIPGERVAGR